MSRAKVIPYYVKLIEEYSGDPFNPEIKRINQLISDKWGWQGLDSIKKKAWKLLPHK